MTINKDEFLAKLKEQYDELNYRWNIERSRYEAKAQHATADVKKKYEEELEELQTMRKQMKEKIVELDVASDNAWEDVKEGAEDAWKSLSEAFKKAADRFS